MTTFTYRVDRLSCGSCRALVTEELAELPGVEAVEVDLDAKQVVVRGDGVTDEAVRALLDEVGYPAS